MKFVREFVDDFASLFRGNEQSHGVHVPEKNPATGQKAQGKSFTRRVKITQEHLLKHLHGEESIGINPLNEFGNIRFAVIDVDVYPLDPKHYLDVLGGLNLPFVGFRSKSGGLHLYMFFTQDTDAAVALPLLQEIRQLLGLPSDTEIFPKQTRLVGASVGNWINLPYFNHKKTFRYAYNYDGAKLNLQDGINFAMDSRVTTSLVAQRLKDAPLADAPPCLQTTYVRGGAEDGHRNQFLFNCAIYLKAKHGKEFAENLHAFNDNMANPIPYEELDRTVISSHNKGDYSYQCDEAALACFCCKSICKDRQYGKGAGTVSDLSFGQLVQVQSSTPYYKWYINDAEMVFHTENELLNQVKFRELCLRMLHKVPNQLKPNAWNEVLNRALNNIVLEEVEKEDDISEDSLWLSKVTEFFSRHKALRPSQIEDGLVWLTDNNELKFKGAKLLEFLDKTGLFRHFKKSQHRRLLDAIGAVNGKIYYVDKGSAFRIWTISLTELQAKGLFLNVRGVDQGTDEYTEEEMTPLDFVGQEKY